MSTERDVTRIVRSWLEEGVTALPDRVLDAVLDQVPATRQRRAWWPARRLPQMNTRIRIAAAAAAVVVLAVIGLNLMPRSAGVGGPPATSAPTVTPAPTLSPVPSPTSGSLTNVASSLTPGTHVAADPFLLQVTFTVPAGWEGKIGGPYVVVLDQPQGLGEVDFSIFEKVYADPCHYDKGLLDPLPGPSVADLATALANMPGLAATTPTDVTMGGYQGKQLTLTAPASFAGCTLSPDGFRVWEYPLGATNVLTPGQRDQVWILDVGGERLVIDAPEVPGQTAATTAEVRGILDSIQIAPGAVNEWPMGPMKAGTYTAAEPFLLPVTFTVPAGWEGKIGGPYLVLLDQPQGPGTVSFSIFEKLYADPCHYKGLLDPLPGPSVADLASALARMPGLNATTPTDVTVAGYEGKQLTLTAPASFAGCTLSPDGKFRVWELPLGATNDMTPGERDRVWILDVGGERLVIDASQRPGQTAATTAQVQAIFDSIKITP